MRILVSAYACNPYGGSEPGVGWTAVCRIARRHDVYVITDIHNKEGWEKGREEGIIPPNVRVRFLRDRSACSDNRFVAHIQSWLNYASFNRQVLQAALAWHAEENLDLCHQVTIATWRMPSPLWRLPIPFVWGPVGGAGYIQPAFRPILSWSARCFEHARNMNSALTLRSRAFRQCIGNASVVLAANEETEILLRPHRGSKPLLRLPIASMPQDKVARLLRPPRPPSNGPLRCFAGGNMIGSKGLSLALRALALAARKGVDFHYMIAGGGPEIPAMKRLAEDLGISARVEFNYGFRGQDYIDALHRADVYLLPSFREGTPVTLLEACLAGCHAVVADVSAQGEIVRMAGGHAVSAANIDAMIDGLADALCWCAANRQALTSLARDTADKIAAGFSSERYDAVLEEAYRIALRA
jgi:glycosyltransferase involved in cell wall biosynthesis